MPVIAVSLQCARATPLPGAWMRAISILMATLTLLQCVAVFAQEAEPFHTRNLSPPIAIFGLPIWEAVTQQRVLTATAEIANHYRLSQRGNDTLILDGETLRMDLFYSRPLGDRWSLSAEVPVLQHSGGMLDDLVDGWHSTFGLPDGGRNNRPEDELLFELATGSQSFLRIDDDRRGLGDLQIGIARRFGADGRFVARASVKAPTGDSDILSGSGSSDWSVTLLRPGQAMLRGRAAGYYWGVGWLDLGEPERVAYPVEAGALVGILGGGVRIFPRIGLKAQIDVYSAMYDTPLEELGQDAVQATIGGWWEWGEQSRLDFAINEDLHVSTAPDVVLHLGLRWNW
jgi:hypothetical protein